MGSFAMKPASIFFGSIFGFLLFMMNFVIIFTTTDNYTPGIIIGIGLFALVYIGFIIKIIREPVTNLKKLTKEDIEDHEYKRVVISKLYSSRGSEESSDEDDQQPDEERH
mmetsp:Transcript_5161/g.7938  ORF Transcript_5161/g.7938 Transcript_5161/m.7938 type:complete len:110 (-) Transcript_5161:140-469(-)